MSSPMSDRAAEALRDFLENEAPEDREKRRLLDEAWKASEVKRAQDGRAAETLEEREARLAYAAAAQKARRAAESPEEHKERLARAKETSKAYRKRRNVAQRSHDRKVNRDYYRNLTPEQRENRRRKARENTARKRHTRS